VAEALRAWRAVDTNTAYIERGSPWENGYIESFNARLRDELLDGEIFYSLREAQTVIREFGGVTTTVSGRTRPRCRARARRVAGCASRTAPPATLAPKPILN
jgi:putative transposase